MTKTTKRRDVRRRIEQLAAHPECQANVTSAAFDVSMKDVAKAEGVELNPEGQSPFAIQRGEQFERTLLKEDAKRLREALSRAGVLPHAAVPFTDLRLTRQGGPCRDLDAALAGSGQLLRDPQGPRLVAGLTLPVEEAGGGVVVLDVVIVHTDGRLQVGEIKSFPDRGGYTDGGKLASARAQAGLYLHVLSSYGPVYGYRVRGEGVLVLARPGRTTPEVRVGEELEFQALRAERSLRQLGEVAAGGCADPLQAVRDAPVAYRETCFRFCARARGCRERAAQAGSGAVLGEGVADRVS